MIAATATSRTTCRDQCRCRGGSGGPEGGVGAMVGCISTVANSASYRTRRAAPGHAMRVVGDPAVGYSGFANQPHGGCAHEARGDRGGARWRPGGRNIARARSARIDHPRQRRARSALRAHGDPVHPGRTHRRGRRPAAPGPAALRGARHPLPQRAGHCGSAPGRTAASSISTTDRRSSTTVCSWRRDRRRHGRRSPVPTSPAWSRAGRSPTRVPSRPACNPAPGS